MARNYNSKTFGYWKLNKLIRSSKRCRSIRGPKVMHKTRVRFAADNYSIIVRHYETDVATITPHKIQLHPNGWWSFVTKKRLNRILQDNETHMYVSYKNEIGGILYDDNWMKWEFERSLEIKKNKNGNSRWKPLGCTLKLKYMRKKTKALLFVRSLIKILHPLGLNSATEIGHQYYWINN